jgi:MarR family transcriptional regulator, lower aerobic nicotinate degradation pathway regulator
MIIPLASMPTWILSSAAARSHQILQKRLMQAGFTGYEYRCLSALAGAEHLSQTDLGVAAALDPRDVTHTVRALEDRGLVSRTKDPGHGRRQFVSLTAQGHQAAQRLVGVMADIQTVVFSQLNAKERATLLELLELIGRT